MDTALRPAGNDSPLPLPPMVLVDGVALTITTIADDQTIHSSAPMRLPVLLGCALMPVWPARFRGSLLALFGPPLTSSTNADDAFTYVLRVTTAQGDAWIITASEGPRGPAFGGPANATTPGHQAAATGVLTLLMRTPPADFVAVLDGPRMTSRITYGCQAGQCFWSEARA